MFPHVYMEFLNAIPGITTGYSTTPSLSEESRHHNTFT